MSLYDSIVNYLHTKVLKTLSANTMNWYADINSDKKDYDF